MTLRQAIAAALLGLLLAHGTNAAFTAINEVRLADHTPWKG
jgi:predicted ribosomally synthesized peptide with SipW-like signal peptide